MFGASPQSDSFEELAIPHFDQLYNFAHWLTQNREEAEDLVQETYVKALKGFSSFRAGTNFRAWMYRILRNTFLTSRTGLRATSTVRLDVDADGPEVAVEDDNPETILMSAPRDPASLRGGGNVVPGDCGISFHPDRYGGVAFMRARKTLRDVLRLQFQKDEPWFVRPGRKNSTPTWTASSR